MVDCWMCDKLNKFFIALNEFFGTSKTKWLRIKV
jgi:hypothetical protein